MRGGFAPRAPAAGRRRPPPPPAAPAGGRGGVARAAAALLSLLAVAPYAIEWPLVAGRSLAYASVIGYVLGQLAHARWTAPLAPGILDLAPSVYLTAILIGVVTVVLVRTPAELAARVREMRHVMEDAEQGDLAVRAPGTAGGEMGILARSFNRMLET